MPAPATGEGGEVDDARATAGPCRRDEVGQGRPRDTTGTAKVDLHDLVPEGVVGVGQGPASDQRAGVVDEHVEAAQEVRGGGNQLVACRGRGEVGGRMSVAATEPGGLGFELARPRGAGVVVDEDVTACRQQVAGDGDGRCPGRPR